MLNLIIGNIVEQHMGMMLIFNVLIVIKAQKQQGMKGTSHQRESVVRSVNRHVTIGIKKVNVKPSNQVVQCHK